MGSKGVVKVPVVLQTEELEGGAACLGMVLGHYQKWVGLGQLRDACGISRDGIQLESIERAAKGYGLNCRTETFTFEELREKAELPAIVQWNEDSYVVYCGIDSKGVRINHPGKGKMHVTEDEFKRSYANTCLFLSPGEKFEPGGRKPGVYDLLLNVLKSHKRMVILVMVTSVLATFMKVGPQRASGVRIVSLRPTCCFEPRIATVDLIDLR